MSSEEKELNVPSEEQLEELLLRAKKFASKFSKQSETLQQRSTRLTNEIIQIIFASETDDLYSPFLMFKCLAIRTVKELEYMHREIANSAFQNNDTSCLHWANDEGKLESAKDLIRSVRIGGNDWMR